ncbi:MAG: hypothetical protein RQ714_06565 [Nitrosomonas sp.]|nr:hypothetical protein [Nitrosomonas sp.]
MKHMSLRDLENEMQNAGVEPGSLESGLSGKKVVQDHEKPIRYSRRNHYHGKKGAYNEAE